VLAPPLEGLPDLGAQVEWSRVDSRLWEHVAHGVRRCGAGAAYLIGSGPLNARNRRSGRITDGQHRRRHQSACAPPHSRRRSHVPRPLPKTSALERAPHSRLSFSFNSPAVLRKHPWQFRRPTHHWSSMTRLGPNDDIRLPPPQPPSTHSLRRNNFTVPSPNDTRAGGQSMGGHHHD
jgi:hypothetical protein